MRTTLTYGDGVRNTRVAQCHVFHMTAVRKFLHFNVRKNIVSEFISQGHTDMKTGELDSSHQIYIGDISRRSHIGSERIYL